MRGTLGETVLKDGAELWTTTNTTGSAWVLNCYPIGVMRGMSTFAQDPVKTETNPVRTTSWQLLACNAVGLLAFGTLHIVPQ